MKTLYTYRNISSLCLVEILDVAYAIIERAKNDPISPITTLAILGSVPPNTSGNSVGGLCNTT